jgi:transmembrane sensor
VNSDRADGFDDDLDPVESAATVWLARRDRGLTPDETVEFARWRAAAPRHEAAVAELGAMWHALDDLSALRGKVASPPASSAPNAPCAGDQVTPMRRWPAGWIWALAASIALIAGIVTWRRVASGAVAAVHYETAVGEQRTLPLPDGSTLQLNTNSAADVRYVARERRVELVRGEIFFSVTKDAQRPFVVLAGGVEARALGTAFVVRRHQTETELVVAEGRVKFYASPQPATSVEVTGGQLATCDPRKRDVPHVSSLDEAALARRLAWKSGRLVCRPGMPLGEAAAEFNRYHRAQLVLRGADTAAVPIGGAFEIQNLDAFVRMLEQSFEIVVVERDAERIVLQSKR